MKTTERKMKQTGEGAERRKKRRQRTEHFFSCLSSADFHDLSKKQLRTAKGTKLKIYSISFFQIDKTGIRWKPKKNILGVAVLFDQVDRRCNI